MFNLAIIFVSLAIIALSFAMLKEISDNKSHWKATTHELAQVWESINVLEGVDPEKVGEPVCCAIPDEDLENYTAK